MGALLSVPFIILLIFFWWVNITSSATVTANTLYKGSLSLKIKRMKTANDILAKIELKETNRVKNKTIRKTPTQHNATMG